MQKGNMKKKEKKMFLTTNKVLLANEIFISVSLELTVGIFFEISHPE